jgi:sulfate permease, SulP family
MHSLAIKKYRLTSGELSGAFADLGVLIPLEASLIALNGLNPTTTLFGIGVIYIVAGLYFGIPMPVQPLKAFSAIAIATAAPPQVIAAGALTIGAIMGLLALLGLVDVLHRVTPLPVVRGIQFGLGLILLRSGFDLIVVKPLLLNGTQQIVSLAGADVPLGLLLGLIGGLLLVLLLRQERVPPAVAVLALGLLVGVVLAGQRGAPSFDLGPAPVSAPSFTLSDFTVALGLLVLPQLPLSLANSIISMVDVAHAYFGEQARKVTPRRVALAYALGNLWAGLAGGLPNCHGAGGLTAHYRLGARTPVASLIIGGTLIAVALLFGQSALAVRNLIPGAIFGVLLLYVGWEHLRLGLNVGNRRALAEVLLVGAASMLAGGNLAVGALVGLVVHWGLQRIAPRLLTDKAHV